MMIQYQPLFEINITHSYFEDCLCKGLQIIPLFHTVEIIEKAGLLIRREKRGLGVYYDEQKLQSLLLILKEQRPYFFAFSLESADELFFNYTDSAPDTREVFWFSTPDVNKVNTVDSLALHQEAFVSEKDIVLLDSDQLKPFLNQKQKLLPPIGIININPEHLLPIQTKNISAFHVNFNCRKTTWRYVITTPSFVNNDNITITDASKVYSFSEPMVTRLANGSIAKEFLSNEEIPLKSEGIYSFQLKEISNNIERILINRMSSADPNNFSKGSTEDNKYISEIYVYY